MQSILFEFKVKNVKAADVTYRGAKGRAVKTSTKEMVIHTQTYLIYTLGYMYALNVFQ